MLNTRGKNKKFDKDGRRKLKRVLETSIIKYLKPTNRKEKNSALNAEKLEKIMQMCPSVSHLINALKENYSTSAIKVTPTMVREVEINCHEVVSQHLERITKLPSPLSPLSSSSSPSSSSTSNYLGSSSLFDNRLPLIMPPSPTASSVQLPFTASSSTSTSQVQQPRATSTLAATPLAISSTSPPSVGPFAGASPAPILSASFTNNLPTVTPFPNSTQKVVPFQNFFNTVQQDAPQDLILTCGDKLTVVSKEHSKEFLVKLKYYLQNPNEAECDETTALPRELISLARMIAKYASLIPTLQGNNNNASASSSANSSASSSASASTTSTAQLQG